MIGTSEFLKAVVSVTFASVLICLNFL